MSSSSDDAEAVIALLGVPEESAEKEVSVDTSLAE
ncbi:hypothetical protein E2C01_091574 [Portunus trituberculatus]|uniref:Uncharacterized protein n=1 Tax=Portunus trituberculatus TaxID=210409 RepID=A0A5B7JJD9_PORTR|nr:hypothetical protein [Portunus trituberculatus]